LLLFFLNNALFVTIDSLSGGSFLGWRGRLLGKFFETLPLCLLFARYRHAGHLPKVDAWQLERGYECGLNVRMMRSQSDAVFVTQVKHK
jgi:hypothetical protein